MNCEIQLKKKLNCYDIKVCRLHRKANSYGMPLDFTSKCQCCSKYSNKEPLSFNFEPFKIFYSGSQLPILLIFMKSFIIIFLVLCLIFTLPLCLINGNGQGCNKIVACNGLFYLTLSVFNSFDNLANINFIGYLSICVFFVIVIVMIYIRKTVYRIEQQIDDVDFFSNNYYLLCQRQDDSQHYEGFADIVNEWLKIQLKQMNWQKKLKVEQQLKIQEKIDKKEETTKKQKAKHMKQRIQMQICKVYAYNNVEDKQKQKQKINKSEKENNICQKKQTLLQKGNCQIRAVIDSRYFLLVFKYKILSKIFFYKNSLTILQKITCCSSDKPLLFNNKKIKFRKNLYRHQIYWQNQKTTHFQTIKQNIPGLVFLVLSLALNAGTLYGIIFVYNKCELDQDDIPFISNNFYILSACMTNIITFFFNKMMGICSSKQTVITYTNSKLSITSKMLINNLMNMYLIPFFIFQAVGNKYLWVNNGYLRCLNWNLIIYMIIHLFDKFISLSAFASYYAYYSMNSLQNYNQKDANLRYTKPQILIQDIYTSVITVVSLNLLIMPFSPYILLFSTVWLFLKFWSQKLCIAYFYAEDEPHGSSLAIQMISICEYCFLPLVFSFFPVLCVFGEFSYPIIPTVFIIISVVLLFLGVILKCSPIQAFCQNFLKCQLEKEKEKTQPFSVMKDIDKTFQVNFSNLKIGQLYPLKVKDVVYDERYGDETNSIQKNLTQTLKQRAFNQRGTILQKKASKQQSTENNDYYFQYEKKIEMKKAEPKIKIPSLFNKSPNIFKNSKQKNKAGLPEQPKPRDTSKSKPQLPNLKIFIQNDQK